MKNNITDWLDQVKQNIKKSSTSLSEMLEQRAEALKTIDDRIEEIIKENEIVKRIKRPRPLKINWRYIVSAPFIYSMLFPAILWHTGIEIYHQICFRLYGIPLVNGKEYFLYDRQLLSWLTFWEKINCIYCSYINNLISYSSEIGGRTERYWCPIKYFRKLNHEHSQYSKFVGKADQKEMREEWEELRDFSDLK